MLISCSIEIPAVIKKQIVQETDFIRRDHPEYTWINLSDYRLVLFQWPDVDEDLLPKLQEKLAELLLDVPAFTLFGLEYRVHIVHSIDVRCNFQEERSYKTIIDTLFGYFTPKKQPARFHQPFLKVAKWKIPSKQQYSHLKNQLAKLTCATEFPVTKLDLWKETVDEDNYPERELVGTIELVT